MADEKLALLVVDDAATDRLRWSALGRRHGIEVWTAADADEAMAHLRLGRPDAVLMDLDMPGTDGVAATKRMREDPDLRRLPIVCHSGGTRTDAAMATGLFDGELPKDLPDERLVSDLRALLGRHLETLHAQARA